MIARVRTRLPRVCREDLSALLPPGALAEDDAPLDLAVLAEAAAAALALPDVRGRGFAAGRARRAAIHAVGQDVPSAALAECLGIGVRSVQVLRTLPSEPNLVRAVTLQARLRSAIERMARVSRESLPRST